MLHRSSLVLVLVVVACGSKPPPAPASPAPVALPDVPFDKLDQDQRKAFMEQKVMPVMKPIFQNHDAHDFAKFQCETCHGKGAASGHFDMPNPELPKLNFGDMTKWKKEDIDWMKGEVLPTMAKTLGLPPHSPENPNGFGCLECHTQEGS